MNLREHLILYVDDEHANRVVFEITFAKEFRVKAVESAEQALAYLATANETVAVLVTDQRMTGMSGDELLRRVKELSPDTVRMIVTAYSDLEPILKAVNEGLVARYVIKPWDRTELAEILRWAVEAHVAGRQNSALQLRLMQTERLRTLGQVSASVLHDLNQPVMAISMSAEQLRDLAKTAALLRRMSASADNPLTSEERQAVDGLGEELSDLSTTLSSCASFMTDLMKQMKQFQRHDTAPPASLEVAPYPVVKLALSMCRSGTTSGSKLTYEGPTDLAGIRATSTDLLQILVNLIRNAQQALEEHNIRQGKVTVETSSGPSHVTFVVKDNGPGIAPDVLARLGTPFYTTRENGTGLGVSQCKRLVGRLGGELDITSEIGSGTSVRFTLPAASHHVDDGVGNRPH